MSAFEEEVEFIQNPEPRCPCVLLLDTSASMSGAPIEALNRGLRVFQADVNQDDLASRRVEVAIVTFGNGGVKKIQEFVTINNFEPSILTAGGTTPMGAAIKTALKMLRERKNQYNENGIPFYRPWVILITDGAPSDNWQEAAEQVHSEERSKSVIFFAVGVANADMQTLAQIAVRPPLMLQGTKFTELFLWLSNSQKRVSGSQIGERVPLPPPDDWSMVSTS